jgi:hypothetical protein
MKVGLSFSRCLLDIVEGRVDINDVLVIVARTDFDPNDDKQWEDIWWGYTIGDSRVAAEWAPYSSHDAAANERFRNTAIDLWQTGKLHQPRKFGWRPQRHRYYWLEAVLPHSELTKNPAVLDAWQKFQTVAGLANVKIDLLTADFS